MGDMSLSGWFWWLKIRTGARYSLFLRDSSDYNTSIHESGHAVFGFREEYCSKNTAQDHSFHSNTFDKQDECTKWSMSSSTCRPIAECSGGGYWKADPDDDPMAGGSGTLYGPDCQRRAQCVLEGMANKDQCP